MCPRREAVTQLVRRQWVLLLGLLLGASAFGVSLEETWEALPKHEAVKAKL
jgi:hypothetical protein